MADGSRCVSAVEGSKAERCKAVDRLTVSPCQLFAASHKKSRFTLLRRD
jgi:hypothetical protein